MDKFTMLARNIKIAAYRPNLVSEPPKFSSFSYNGVFEVVSSFSSKTPLLLLAPTQQTTALPDPDATSV